MISTLAGFIAGTLHVWSGPDHLAAIAPLAARHPARAWLPGAKWGLGHSAGVALVGVISLWLREWLPMEVISAWGERMVGLMLIAIGAWGLRKTFQIRLHAHAHDHGSQEHAHVHLHAGQKTPEAPAKHGHAHAALGIGILHGLAGSSHFFGVLPVLALPTRTEAAAYLIAFAAGTILSMMAFSTLIGFLAKRTADAGTKVYRVLMGTCGAAAVIVGCVWLVLSWRAEPAQPQPKPHTAGQSVQVAR